MHGKIWEIMGGLQAMDINTLSRQWEMIKNYCPERSFLRQEKPLVPHIVRIIQIIAPIQYFILGLRV